jgi:cell division protein FtsB
MSTAVRRAAYTAALGLMALYGYVALTGPQGIPALRAKWTEIRQLEEENANLKRDNEYKKERIERLKNDPAEQELEIRKRLKLQRPGETTFILPEHPK